MIGFALFALQQRHTAAAGRQPLVTPGLLCKPAFTVGLAGIALFFGGLIGTQLVLTLFLQIGQHFTAGEAGLGNLPLAVGTAIGGAVSGAFLADKPPRRRAARHHPRNFADTADRTMTASAGGRLWRPVDRSRPAACAVTEASQERNIRLH
ncbi:hypothetical protein [Catellatospora tritici]|uniref:hypothetical protein n=1 Tax=Catellatospora tritici TaxID=2851566 RepID=UPI001C2CC838|nr:hypothetical protein [Catellatospora tritici]MBV1856411.1 hypothetical protein [Catellatospora tritici]